MNLNDIFNQPRACCCIGPQNGQPLCPCMMRGVKIKEGRWVKEEDLGPAPGFEKPRWEPNIEDIPCLHKQCSSCHGTGVKDDGSACIHMISCPCRLCTLTF